MSLLFSGPPELVARVFESCTDFGDALALALTCKNLHSVWNLNLSKITLEIARTSVLSFDEALIAVRATEIVRVAEKSAQLCPEINILSLSEAAQQPTFSELRSVLDIRHFVRFIEFRFLRRKNTETSWGRGSAHLLDEAPHLLESWRLGFHRALYRFFISGAVLARAYQAPVYENFVKVESGRGQGFLNDAISLLRDCAEGEEDKITWLPVRAAELNTLNKYPVYNFTPHEDWEKCFGHLADWLVESIRTRLSHDTKFSGNERAIEQAALREIMQLLVMSGQFFDTEDGIWPGIQAPYWSKHYLDTTNHCICQSRPEVSDAEDEYEEYIPTQGPQERLRKFSYVTFCGFTCVELQLPAVREFHENSSILGGVQEDRKRKWDVPELPDIRGLCGLLYCMSGRPNRVNGHPAPHPPLHFFTFVLRKHFASQFDEMAFEMNTPKQLYANFIRKGKIFAEKEVRDGDETEWEGMLTSMHEVQILHYIQTTWTC